MSDGRQDQCFVQYWTLNSRAFFLRIAYLSLAFPVVLLLALRPIPTQASSNDTGRYIANQADACSLPMGEDASLSLPLRAFNVIMRPACSVPDPAAFLFIAGISLPLALVIFGGWRSEGAVLIAVSALVSTVGFEFMTNALRQGVSLTFLLGAFAFSNRYVRIAALAAALLIHDSSWFYAPLVLLLIAKSDKVKIRTIVLWGIPLTAGILYLIVLRFASTFSGISDAWEYYISSYANESSPAFLLFIVCPLFFIFAIRRFDRKAALSPEERLTFYYSAIILACSIVIFPVITYRFAMTAILLQLFLAMRNSRLSAKSAVAIFLGMAAHFAFYAFWGKNVMAVLNG
jgi:hypothetical protein